MTTGAPGTCCAPLGAPGLSDDQAEATARVFKALADPHRVRIGNLLATSPDPVCVCEFTGPLGLSEPTVSHHLKSSSRLGCWSASSAAPRNVKTCSPWPTSSPGSRSWNVG
jgi:predicted transcriptional regulator